MKLVHRSTTRFDSSMYGFRSSLLWTFQFLRVRAFQPLSFAWAVTKCGNAKYRLTCFCLSLVRISSLSLLYHSLAHPLSFVGLRSNHSYRQRTQRQLSKQDERMDWSLGGREETKERCENAKSHSLSRWELLVGVLQLQVSFSVCCCCQLASIAKAESFSLCHLRVFAKYFKNHVETRET